MKLKKILAMVTSLALVLGLVTILPIMTSANSSANCVIIPLSSLTGSGGTVTQGAEFITFEHGTGSGNDWATVRFSANFGTFELSDYEALTLTWEGVQGDTGWKPAPKVFARADAFSSQDSTADSAASVAAAAGWSDNGINSKNFSFDLDGFSGLQNESEVFFAFAPGLAAVGNQPVGSGTDVPTTYKVSNVKLKAVDCNDDCATCDPGVVAPITFTTQPAATTTVTVGAITGSLTVAATATSGNTVSFQWQQETATNTWTDVASGATSATFAIPTALAVGTYKFRCVVSEGSDSANSNVATVVVQPNIPTNTPVIDADSSAVYQIRTFTGLTIANDQYVNGYGIQRMAWSGHMGLNFAGTQLTIGNGSLAVTNETSANSRGIQFQGDYGHTQTFQGKTGVEYKVVIEAAALSTAGNLNIVPDNHPSGVAKTFTLPMARTEFELTWTQVEHEHNNLQISSDVDFVVFNVTIYSDEEPEGPGGGDEPTEPDPDVQGLVVSGRTDAWFGLDVLLSTLPLHATNNKIIVTGSSSEAFWVHFPLDAAPWDMWETRGNRTGVTSDAFPSAMPVADNGVTQNDGHRVRIRTATTADFTITSVVIEADGVVVWELEINQDLVDALNSGGAGYGGVQRSATPTFALSAGNFGPGGGGGDDPGSGGGDDPGGGGGGGGGEPGSGGGDIDSGGSNNIPINSGRRPTTTTPSTTTTTTTATSEENEVVVGTDEIIVDIPIAAINEAAGASDLPVIQLSIESPGPQVIAAGRASAGQNAILVRFNAETGELEVVNVAVVGTDGNATVNVPTEGDYLVIVRQTGDITGTGKVESTDALELLKALTGQTTLSPIQQFVATGTGRSPTATDALNILKLVVGAIGSI
ncbi:MAG: hypothetical protein FWG70_00890 [Oscillospiraceae bacterium]|nr:hypothetical protein [Oscillospiraceae bacterium]